jgi:PAS domain S-box-containing protein
MGRRASSDRDPGNGAGRRALRAGDPGRIARAAAGLRGNGGNGDNGTAGAHVVEARRAEAALAFAAAIVEFAHDAIIGTTLDGMIMSWNAGAERLYGYSASEVLGWPIGIIIPGDELPKSLKRIGRGEGVDRRETVVARKDGRRVDVSVTVSPIRDTNGRIVGASSISHDIAHRKEVEAAVRERDVLRYVAGLAAAAAHEINNPLAAVMGYAHLLADEVSAKGRGRIDQILDALSRVQEIIVRMNHVTRIELTDEAPHLPEMLEQISEPSPPRQHEPA